MAPCHSEKAMAAAKAVPLFLFLSMAFANVHKINPGKKLWRFHFDSFPHGKWKSDHKSFVIIPSVALEWVSYRGLFLASIWVRFLFWAYCFSYFRPQPNPKPILPGQSTGQNENQKPL